MMSPRLAVVATDAGLPRPPRTRVELSSTCRLRSAMPSTESAGWSTSRRRSTPRLVYRCSVDARMFGVMILSVWK